MKMWKNALLLSLAMLLLCGTAALALAAAQKAPAKASPKATTAESEDVVKQKLDVAGRKLVQDAARTVTPSAKAKAVSQEGGEFVARYVDVDESSMTTEVRPATGPGGQYIGVIKYMENQYECRGKSKDEALKAPCAMVKSRRMNELIRYDGKWTF